jgi:hypothetical protein
LKKFILLICIIFLFFSCGKVIKTFEYKSGKIIIRNPAWYEVQYSLFVEGYNKVNNNVYYSGYIDENKNILDYINEAKKKIDDDKSYDNLSIVNELKDIN